MGTRRPSMKYRDNINGVHVYDVVRIGRGYFKDKLAICTWVDFLKRELKLKVIDNGIDITLRILLISVIIILRLLLNNGLKL